MTLQMHIDLRWVAPILVTIVSYLWMFHAVFKADNDWKGALTLLFYGAGATIISLFAWACFFAFMWLSA